MGRANKNQAYVSFSTDDEWRSGSRANSFVSKWVLGTAMVYDSILGGTRLWFSANFAKRKKSG